MAPRNIKLYFTFHEIYELVQQLKKCLSIQMFYLLVSLRNAVTVNSNNWRPELTESDN